MQRALRLWSPAAAGFIGSHLARRLLRDGHEVRVLDNFSTGRRSNIGRSSATSRSSRATSRATSGSHNAVRGCEVVFHQAALPSVPRSVQDPLTSNAANVTGTLNVLLAARDAACAASSTPPRRRSTGPAPALPKDEDRRPLPISPYAVAKLAGEGYCRSFTRGLRPRDASPCATSTSSARARTRTRQYAAVIPRFITAAARRAAAGRSSATASSRATSPTSTTWSQANMEALAAPRESPAGLQHRLRRAHHAQRAGHPDHRNRRLGRRARARAARVGDVRHSMACIERARADLGYEPEVSFADGLARPLRSSAARHPGPTGSWEQRDGDQRALAAGLVAGSPLHPAQPRRDAAWRRGVIPRQASTDTRPTAPRRHTSAGPR